tara:strand:+ start:95 stop:583 length:489 start_codon:yes stop_codon:yes gene_type:complete
MSWKNILKRDDGYKRVLQMAKKVLRGLGLDEKFVDDNAVELANSDKLFAHIPFHPLNSPETDEEMFSKVTEESLRDMVMADKGFYLPNLLSQDERFIQQKKESWAEGGHEILEELFDAIDNDFPLPKWAVLTSDGGLDESATEKKFINEAKRDDNWSVRNYY